MSYRVFALAIVFIFLSGCGENASTGTIQSIGAENFDRMLEECLVEAEITDDPLENVLVKFDSDPVYGQKFESCVHDIAPNDADMILSDHMSFLRELPKQRNTRLLKAMSCVEDRYDIVFGGEITYRIDQHIDFDAVLRSFLTDIEAFEYWVYLEECGWIPAPDVDPANFVLQHECLNHEHNGEPLHSHGVC